MLGIMGVIEMTLGRDKEKGEGCVREKSHHSATHCCVLLDGPHDMVPIGRPRDRDGPRTRGEMSSSVCGGYTPASMPSPRHQMLSLVEVQPLTVQSQLSPRDGHRTSSGNEPRVACQEWDTGSETRRLGWPQTLPYFLGIHLALTIPCRLTFWTS